MFSIGDYIVYNGSDICRVKNIGRPDTRAARMLKADFYFLETQFPTGMIYIPVTTKIPMRAVITKEEALTLIARLPDLETAPCASSDKKRLSEHYSALTESADCESMARTAKTIYLKYHQGGRTRLPNSTEAMYYKRASDLLLQELSVSLGESIEDVQKRIEAVCSPDAAMKWNL